MKTVFEELSRCVICDDKRTRRRVINYSHNANIANAGPYPVCKFCLPKVECCSECGVFSYAPRFGTNKDGSRVCQTCFLKKGLGICLQCNRLTADKIVVNGSKVFECKEHVSHYTQCDVCMQHDYIGSIAMLRKKKTCRACYSKLMPKIESSCCRSYQQPIGEGPLFMGVELEVEVSGSRESVLPALSETLGEFCIFKNDGSLNNGIEIVSCPCSFDVHKKIWNQFFDSTPTVLSAQSNCGIHIHVSKKPLNQAWIARIIRFIGHPKNIDIVREIAGRYNTNYCRIVQGIEKMDDVAAINHCTIKYSAVNMVPENTIEFRIFASTLDKARFIRNIEFVHAVVSFCKEPSSTIEGFNDFVSSNSESYPLLNHTINKTTNENVLSNS